MMNDIRKERSSIGGFNVTFYKANEDGEIENKIKKEAKGMKIHF